MQTQNMYELAEQLKQLREKKKNAEQRLKEMNAEIEQADYQLSMLMAETETQNFTRAGTTFALTTKIRASAVAGRKEELYAALKENGCGDLVYETINAISLSAFVKGQIAAAGLGITLTAASTMVFYSLDYSMSNFEQAKARIHRVSQTENCLYIYLIAKNTVDAKILHSLRDKVDLARTLVDDYRNGMNPFQEGV